jgi:FAD/FMN-containing dehydrogenase
MLLLLYVNTPLCKKMTRLIYNTQVKYCTQNRIPFLTQNGGNGWAKTFNLGKTGVLINTAGLNAITFTNDKKQATIGGGAIIGDVIPAANAAGALVITGNCNCIGAVGALLGGGYGMLIIERAHQRLTCDQETSWAKWVLVSTTSSRSALSLPAVK